MKAALFLALLGLFLTTVFAETTEIAEPAEIEGTEREGHYYYKPCPCKCFTGYDEHRADKVCHSYRYRFHCAVKSCKKGYYHQGKACCDKPKPKPSPSKSPKPKIVCPCKCGKKKTASHQCYYKPYCEVTKCKEEHPPHHPPHYGYGYYKPRPKFQCCYKPYYGPHHEPHHEPHY